MESDRRHALLALNRYGYGARGAGNVCAARRKIPAACSRSSLTRRTSRLPGASLPSSRDALQALFAERQRVQAMREKEPAQPDAAPATPA